jgi:hypothetical protein
MAEQYSAPRPDTSPAESMVLRCHWCFVSCQERDAGMTLAFSRAEASMKVQQFVHRHYSASVGESPIGHAAAVLAGILLMGVARVSSVRSEADSHSVTRSMQSSA